MADPTSANMEQHLESETVREGIHPPSPPASPPNGWLGQPVTVVASSNVVLEGRLTPATIVISNGTGKIIAVFDSILESDVFPEARYIDHSPHFILPGLVDAHVHLNEPGRTEWEGFHTGTRAAAFGGVTTVIDMPLNAIPPTTTVANLNEKIRAAQGKCWVDVGFYGGLIPGNTSELKLLLAAGVRGFKAFLIESGVEEFPAVSSDDIRACFQELAHEDTVVMFHAESDRYGYGHSSSATSSHDDPTEYQTFLDSRPPLLETAAVDQILSLTHIAPSLPIHIVHLSAVESVPLLRAARAQGVKVTAETCPHYLSLAAEEVRQGDTRYKCCPPIRDQDNQDQLWNELQNPDGVIKTIVSDHSPCTPRLKLLPSADDGTVIIPGSSADIKSGVVDAQSDLDDSDDGDFFQAWGGISSVGLTLPIIWTEMTSRGLTRDSSKAISSVVQWCCINTARQIGFESLKGDLRVGMDADICVFDPLAEWSVKHSSMLFRNKVSPYQGRRMTGIVRETWLRGHQVFVRADVEGNFGKGNPTGQLLLQPRGPEKSLEK